MIQRIQQHLYRPVDNSALILFRILFGLLMVAECFGAIALGWVGETFVEVEHSFPFFGFGWTQLLIGHGMYVYFVVMGLVSLAVMLGYRYRWSMPLLALMWSIAYFMQKSHYNNHYYLVMLVAWWMIWMPAHTYASLDVKYGRVARSLTCPNWCVLFFKIQFAIMYLYATVAKLYPDWLLAKPTSIWMTSKADLPIVGPLLAQDYMPYFLAYGGILFDGLVIPMLLWRRTRVLALVLSVFFHIFNSAVFHIGIFPYFALAVTAFYFDAETIRRIFFRRKGEASTDEMLRHEQPSSIRPLTWIFILYMVANVLIPLRHHLIEGNVLWDEAGHRLSWRMMLRSKSGYCNYKVVLPDSSIMNVPTRDFIARHQRRDVATRPDMLYTAVQYLKEDLHEQGIDPQGIYCDCKVKINGRPYQQFTKPNYNMIAAKWDYFGRQAWIAEEPDLGFTSWE